MREDNYYNRACMRGYYLEALYTGSKMMFLDESGKDIINKSDFNNNSMEFLTSLHLKTDKILCLSDIPDITIADKFKDITLVNFKEVPCIHWDKSREYYELMLFNKDRIVWRIEYSLCKHDKDFSLKEFLNNQGEHLFNESYVYLSNKFKATLSNVLFTNNDKYNFDTMIGDTKCDTRLCIIYNNNPKYVCPLNIIAFYAITEHESQKDLIDLKFDGFYEEVKNEV